MNRVAIVLFAVVSLQADYAAPPGHSTSPSRQFVIYGTDAKLRRAVSSLAEETKGNLSLCCANATTGRRLWW